MGTEKDEVSPMGEACAGSLNPSNLLHFSFQGEIRKRTASVVEGFRSDISGDIRSKTGQRLNR